VIVRIERRVPSVYGDGTERIVSVEVDDLTDEFGIARACAAIEDVADKVARLSSCCLVPIGVVHRPTCRNAPESLIADCREQAIKAGMRPWAGASA
jgi:hypothetical protein